MLSDLFQLNNLNGNLEIDLSAYDRLVGKCLLRSVKYPACSVMNNYN